MKLSDIIEAYINEGLLENDYIELRRCELADRFNCVPSQINYVISTRFMPELGFYIESRRGGGGYIKISKFNISSKHISDFFDKIQSNLSQSVIDIYLDKFVRYNILDAKTAEIVKVAVSDKSLCNVDTLLRDSVRYDIFKQLILNII